MDTGSQADGYRRIVQRDGKRVRNAHDWSDRYPLISEVALRNPQHLVRTLKLTDSHPEPLLSYVKIASPPRRATTRRTTGLVFHSIDVVVPISNRSSSRSRRTAS